MTVTDENALTKKIPLIEMFGPTIQGEGALIGQQTYFLRFGGCDYRCTMCDSMHAVDPEQIKANAKWLTQDEIADDVKAFAHPDTTPWVTFSGGNPCIHNLSHLVKRLHDQGMKIAVETQGTFWQEWLRDCDIITVSPKGPGMGERFDLEIFESFINSCALRESYLRGPKINIKVVVFGPEDLEFAKTIYGWCLGSWFDPAHFYLSQGNSNPPGHLYSDTHVALLCDMLRTKYLTLFNMIKNDPDLCNLKFLPQWHVWLWGNRQGV